jgi:ABC-type cobalt transport system substrate-binding protein
MNKITQIINHTPSTQEFEVYDDYKEYHRAIANSKDYKFSYDLDEWKLKTIDGKSYMKIYNHGNKILTVEAYVKMVAENEKTFQLRECDLIRTQHNSNTRFTGNRNSVEEVIEYMRNEKNSWLPTIYVEVATEIEKLTKEYEAKVAKLTNQIQTLLDDEYLKKHISSHLIIKGEN